MPETIESEVPTTSQKAKKRNERTEAKFFEDVEKIIAEAVRLGAEFDPPNAAAGLSALQAKRGGTLAARAVNQANNAAEETKRNDRENLFKTLNGDVTSLVGYAKSAGKAANEIAALGSIARDIKGARAKSIDPSDAKQHISVSNLSYATRADNYAAFIEQYDALQIPTGEEKFKAATHRAKHAALAQANNAVIAAESNSNTAGESLDRLAYTGADSLLNACIAAKAYIKSKYGATGQSYKNIAKTRFRLPSRLRKK